MTRYGKTRDDAWLRDPVALEIMFRGFARDSDWQGCEAALRAMVPVDVHRAEILLQALRVAVAAGGLLVFPTPSAAVIEMEQRADAERAAAREGNPA